MQSEVTAARFHRSEVRGLNPGLEPIFFKVDSRGWVSVHGFNSAIMIVYSNYFDEVAANRDFSTIVIFTIEIKKFIKSPSQNSSCLNRTPSGLGCYTGLKSYNNSDVELK